MTRNCQRRPLPTSGIRRRVFLSRCPPHRLSGVTTKKGALRPFQNFDAFNIIKRGAKALGGDPDRHRQHKHQRLDRRAGWLESDSTPIPRMFMISLATGTGEERRYFQRGNCPIAAEINQRSAYGGLLQPLLTQAPKSRSGSPADFQKTRLRRRHHYFFKRAASRLGTRSGRIGHGLSSQSMARTNLAQAPIGCSKKYSWSNAF